MYQSGSRFDELRILNGTLTPEEINASFMRPQGNYSNTSLSWDMGGLQDGSYEWNCLAYDNESQSAWNDTNFTLNVDTSPPVLNYANITPNASGELDPGVLINVTANLTDFIGVNSVILQYKYDVDWINITMNNIGGDLWNASFLTVSTERVYYYRVWANDSSGHSNTSESYSVNITYDYTWSMNGSNFDSYGLVNTVENVGLIRINNTGDDTLIITITDDWLKTTYYNTTEQFPIAAGSVIDVNVTAEYASQDSVYNITITFSAEPSAPGKTASPSSSQSTATLNSYSGGPYFDVDMVNYPTSVSQSTTGIYLNATIKNIGNETATGVWFNWTLPSGWTVISGDQNTYAGSLNARTTNTSGIVVSVTSDAARGTATVCMNASDDNTINESACVLVGVLCSDTDGVCGQGCSYLDDSDCSAPVTITGGGSSTVYSGGVIREYGLELSAPSRIDVFRGNDTTFYIGVSNAMTWTSVTNLTLSVAGYSRVLMQVSPEMIDEIGYNGSSGFRINISVPGYMRYGMHNLTFNISGNRESVYETVLVTLFVHSATENETLEAFSVARDAVSRMQEEGMNTVQVSDMFRRASDAIDQWDYDTAKELSESIAEISGKAFSVHGQLGEVSSMIDEASAMGIQVPETSKLHSLSMAAFDRGDYDVAQERINNAVLAYSLEGGVVFAAKFISAYWWLILMVFFTSLVGQRHLRIMLARNKLGLLSREQSVIKNIIKQSQTKRFLQGKTGRRQYNIDLRECTGRLMKIDKERTQLKSAKFPLFGFRGFGRDLVREKAHINNLIRDVQRRYFEFGSISKSHYEKSLRELKEQLLEIDRKKPLFLVLLFIIVSSFVFTASAADSLDHLTTAVDAIGVAEVHIHDMQTLGFGTERLNDTLDEARLLFSRGNYLGSETLAKYIGTLKNSAINAREMANIIEIRVYESDSRGMDVTMASSLLEDAFIALGSEMYEDAETLLLDAQEELDDLEAKQSLSLLERSLEEKAYQFIETNWFYLLLVSITATAITVLAYMKTAEIRKKRKLRSLKEEASHLRGLIARLQSRYFEHGSIPKMEYDIAVDKYQKRLNEIQRSIDLAGM